MCATYILPSIYMYDVRVFNSNVTTGDSMTVKHEGSGGTFNSLQMILQLTCVHTTLCSMQAHYATDQGEQQGNPGVQFLDSLGNHAN